MKMEPSPDAASPVAARPALRHETRFGKSTRAWQKSCHSPSARLAQIVGMADLRRGVARVNELISTDSRERTSLSAG